MGLYFGNLAALDIWHDKALAAYRSMGLPVSRNYGAEGEVLQK